MDGFSAIAEVPSPYLYDARCRRHRVDLPLKALTTRHCLYKTELIRLHGPWHRVDHLEPVAAKWGIGSITGGLPALRDIPPAQLGAAPTLNN